MVRRQALTRMSSGIEMTFERNTPSPLGEGWREGPVLLLISSLIEAISGGPRRFGMRIARAPPSLAATTRK
jgi:hypothetical protein